MKTNEKVLKAFDSVKDVGTERSFSELGWLQIVSVAPPKIVVRLTLPDFAQAQRGRIANAIRESINDLQDIEKDQITSRNYEKDLHGKIKEQEKLLNVYDRKKSKIIRSLRSLVIFLIFYLWLKIIKKITRFASLTRSVHKPTLIFGVRPNRTVRPKWPNSSAELFGRTVLKSPRPCNIHFKYFLL